MSKTRVEPNGDLPRARSGRHSIEEYPGAVSRSFVIHARCGAVVTTIAKRKLHK